MRNSVFIFYFIISLLFGSAQAEERLQVANLDTDPSEQGVMASNPWGALNPDALKLRSASVMVVDHSGNVVYAKHENEPRPIASITKLMMAMVVLDSGLPLQHSITITSADRDTIKGTGSRLRYGATLTREDMLRLALLASENRAANALARNYPGGRNAFVAAMNAKAQALGMENTHFAGPAGLDPANVSSAKDLVKMVRAARDYPLIREATTTAFMTVYPFAGRGGLRFGNTNRLVRRDTWEIGLSKTGFINEAGRCLVMQAAIAEEPLYIVLLDSYGRLTPVGDSNRLRRWILSSLH